MSADPAHLVRLSAAPARGLPALFLDRDGTVIDDPGYISDPDKVRLIPGAAEALRRFAAAGYALVVVTNQSGVGRGLYSLADYEAVSERMRALLAAEGVTLDAEVACAHSPEDGDRCGWRKPAPGMILAAAGALSIDLARSIIAGDKLSDIAAGAAAGVPRAVHVLTGHGLAERPLVLAAAPGKMRLDLADDLSTLAP